LVLEKLEGFSQKDLREKVGLRVDFAKVGEFFFKITEDRPIWAIYAPDPTNGNCR
jgi:hypothetical protein